MTKAATIYEFFNSFGITAYAATSVPEDAIFPYLTYELVIDAWDGGEVNIPVNLWFYTESEAIPNAKAQQISEAIGNGGKLLSCDGGYVWLKRGSPWCQSLRDDTSANIKRRYINVIAEYFTLN